jgi:hypothetical protein
MKTDPLSMLIESIVARLKASATAGTSSRLRQSVVIVRETSTTSLQCCSDSRPLGRLGAGRRLQRLSGVLAHLPAAGSSRHGDRGDHSVVVHVQRIHVRQHANHIASKKTVQSAVFQAVGQYGTDYTALCSGLIIALVPVVIIYLALQRQFISGLTAGTLKG